MPQLLRQNPKDLVPYLNRSSLKVSEDLVSFQLHVDEIQAPPNPEAPRMIKLLDFVMVDSSGPQPCQDAVFSLARHAIIRVDHSSSTGQSPPLR
ncbi:hypothetical protein LTS07_006009 [Exophiala sideris]|uniref:Uncharacterized protein n=1 Tax=Exophiala sideris TaxID=1016849 RepID=A0ABR0J875_9EURO|nr:hypothetical protein LTS07_006009 [Exophiala sideris]KAK5058175.1 hypothetical protein LTR69_007173 [Exophiala sideris]KAK5182135.1 hypothetical protein LTR44_005736 [Eurotiomycetes sp. CCFEE 6388]